MKSPSQDGTPIGRRAILRTAALLPVAAALTTGCTALSQPEEPDPLEALVERARSDAALARAIRQAHPALAAETAAVETARSDHARALQQEIDRVSPTAPETTTPTSPAPAPPAPQGTDEAAAALKRALREAQEQAADTVSWMPPHRAGLTGSVSASCASLLEVLS